MSTQTNLHCTSTLLIRLDIEGHWLSFILAICTGFRGTPEGVVDARCSKIGNHPGIGRSKGQSDHLQVRLSHTSLLCLAACLRRRTGTSFCQSNLHCVQYQSKK